MLLVCLVLCVLCAGPAVSRIGPFGILKGRVIDADTGVPITGASVVFKVEGESIELRDEAAVTQSNGKFVISPLYVGPGCLVVEAKGYHTLRTVVVIKNRGVVASFNVREFKPRSQPFAAVSGDGSRRQSGKLRFSPAAAGKSLGGKTADKQSAAGDISTPVLDRKGDEELVILISKLDRDRLAGHIVKPQNGDGYKLEHLFSTVKQLDIGDDGQTIVSGQSLPVISIPEEHLLAPGTSWEDSGETYVLVDPAAVPEAVEFVPDEQPVEEKMLFSPSPGSSEKEKVLLSDAQEPGENADTYSEYSEDSDTPMSVVSDQEKLEHSGGWQMLNPAAEEKPEDLGLTVVSLIDEVTSKPLKGAVIKLDGAEAETIGGGHYRLPAMEPGEHYLSVELDGYETILNALAIGDKPEHYTLYMKTSESGKPGIQRR